MLTMTKDGLKTMLESRDLTFRRVAIDEIVMSFPQHADLFFSAFHNDDELTIQMADAARQWMPVLRDGYDESVTPFVSAEDYTIFGDLAGFYSEFIHEMRKDLEKLQKTEARKMIDTLWYQFPGLRVDLKGVTEYRASEEHRQLMVFVTGKCNMHCPYCFSKELKRLSISKDDMARILTWAQRQNVQSLLPCGGEPLLYENMAWLIQEVEKHAMKMYFATNLSVPLPETMLKASKSIGQLHVHITDELFHDKSLMSVFRNNLFLCRENGIDIILRGNIFGDTENHCDEWLSIAKEYGISSLNVAFAMPSHTGSNSFVHVDEIQSMTPILKYLWERGRENNIQISLAKPLPLCVLPEDLALDILRHNNNATYCNVSEDGGMHNLSLSTDLRFSPCLGVDEPSVPFNEDIEWNSLREVFSRAINALQSQPLLKRCGDCFLYHRRLCQGTCLSYKQDSRNGGVTC